MKEKIERIKNRIPAGQDQYQSEVVSALERLGEELTDESDYPGKENILATVAETAEDLEGVDDKPEGFFAKRWAGLVEELEEWEDEHPRISLLVGDIASALANSGI